MTNLQVRSRRYNARVIMMQIADLYQKTDGT